MARLAVTPPAPAAAGLYESLAASTGPPLRIVTRCQSVDDFIGAFRRLVSEHHIVLALKTPRPLGAMLRFSLELAGGVPVFEGVGRVVDFFGGRPGTTAGVKVEIVVLAEESRTMHLCLLMASEPVPASADAARQLAAELQRRMRDTLPLSADMLAEVTRRVPAEPASEGMHALGSGQGLRVVARATMPPLVASEPVPVPAPVPEPVAAAAAGPCLPANPLGELSAESLEHFVECRIYEDLEEGRPVFVSGELETAAIVPVALPVPPAPAPTPRPSPAGPRRARLPIAALMAAVLLAAVIGTMAGYLLWGRHAAPTPTPAPAAASRR